MNSRFSTAQQFWIVLCVTLGLGIAASQFMARTLGFRTAPMLPFDYGSESARTRVFAASSSLGYYGLDWGVIATNNDWFIRRYDIPGASPCEMEAGQKLTINVQVSILVISAFDMDEDFISHFRPPLAPLSQTIRDLRQSHSSWAFAKRTVSLYPEYWLQQIVPTAGTSIGVMVGLRSCFSTWLKHTEPAEKAVLNGSEANFPTDRISTWNKGRMLRNIALSEAASMKQHFYNGPKQQALWRMLQVAQEHGRVFVVVMPVSPAYRGMVGEKVMNAFEDQLARLSRNYPKANLLRLDQFKALDDDSYFWDLEHLNAYGRPIATSELNRRLRELNLGK